MKKDNYYFIDTNIFLRVLIKEKERIFQESFLVLKLIKEKKISAFTSSLVLAEVVWVLNSCYGFKKKEIIQAIKGILNLKNLQIIDKFDPYLAISFYEKYKVKFIDAFIASHYLISKKEAIIVSYDKDFDKLKLKRKEPSQIITNF